MPSKNPETKTEYSDQSISSLKGADRVRLKPSVMFGSDGLEGCEQSFFEILSNSIDEAREGYGKKICVRVFRDMTLEVEDFGRGVPLDWNEKEQRYNWELIYCELYAGGKYDNRKNGSYKFSLGTNGLGACATQYSSEFMDVVSRKGQFVYSISFKEGKPVTELSKEPAPSKSKTGTLVRWKPDIKVFTDINIPLEYFISTLKMQAVVNAGLEIELYYEFPEAEDGSSPDPYRETFLYKDGLTEYVCELTHQRASDIAESEKQEEAEISEDPDDAEDSDAPDAGKNLTLPVFIQTECTGKDREDQPEYDLLINAAFCFSTRYPKIEYYHNSSFLEHGGSPEKATRAAFTKVIDAYLRNNGKYQKADQKITFSDVEECLVLVISSFSTYTSYANQTKKAINNVFIEKAMTDFLANRLEVYFAENPADAERIATQVMINKKSRENAEAMRINLKKKLSSSLDISNRVEKFVNCRSKDPKKRELFIVEGDSALSSCKLGRDADFQAIIPVRGKTLNCLKASYTRIFKSDIIVDLLKVIGCGVEIRSKAHKELADFDLNSLKWSKIIICTDADEDGFQIRTLILTMLYRLLPTLIKEGKVFIAESPLYEINTKDKTMFAYDEKEKTAILGEIGNAKYTIQRSKGLGENEPEMMWLTTMSPATRRLIKIMPEDEEKTFDMFNVLLGNDLHGRKRFIAENGHNYIDLADI